MLPCAPRPAGAEASASATRRRVSAGVITSSTTPSSTARLHAAGDLLVLLRQLGVQRLALVVGGGGELAPVQDPDGGLGAHHGDLGVRPGEHRGRAQGLGVHRDVGAADRPCGSPASPAGRPPRRTRAAASRRAGPRRPTPGRHRAGSRARRRSPAAGCRTRRTSGRTGEAFSAEVESRQPPSRSGLLATTPTTAAGQPAESDRRCSAPTWPAVPPSARRGGRSISGLTL